MPFLLTRTASVLAAGFLLTGPSAPALTSASSPAGSLAASKVAPCPAHWTGDQFRFPAAALPAGLNSQIASVAALSPTDVWMLITRTDKHGNTVSTVYHYVGTGRRESTGLAENERSFGAKWIVARSDTNVWVIGSARGALQAWQYDGSSWTDHPPARYPYAGIDTAALDRNGVLYLAGNNRNTHKGIILSYGRSQWADVSPASPPHNYGALAVTDGGVLIAGGGGRNDGTLQERSGATWITVSLSAPVKAISRVSVAPDGTVYGVGSVAGDQPVFIRQAPGSRSATILDPPTAGPHTTFRTSVVALGLDVWLLGEDEPHQGWHHSWITHDDSGFITAERRISQVTGHRSDQSCWLTAASRTGVFIRALPGSSWCARCCDAGQSLRHGGARQLGCSCHGRSRWGADLGATWPIQSFPGQARSSLKGHSPKAVSPRQPARSGTLPLVPAIRAVHRLRSPVSAELQARLAPSSASASRLRRAAPAGC
jgi:hypothetical protein